MAPQSIEHALLPRYDDARLLARYHRDRDPRDRDALVARFLPLARHLSRTYATGREREDLEQVALVGLLNAIDRFDPERGVAFSSFATPTILGELKRYFRDLGWAVRVPRRLQELAQRLDGAIDELTRELGRAPTSFELAERCETTVEEVVEARALDTAHRAISLDEPLTEDGDQITRGQALGAGERGYDRAEASADLDRLLVALTERERTILRLRFHEDLTQREIAARVGVSQMQISRVIRSAVTKLADATVLDPAPRIG